MTYDPLAQDPNWRTQDPPQLSCGGSSPFVVYKNAPFPSVVPQAALTRLLHRQAKLTELFQQQPSVQLRSEQRRIDRRIQELRKELDVIHAYNVELKGEPEIVAP